MYILPVALMMHSKDMLIAAEIKNKWASVVTFSKIEWF